MPMRTDTTLLLLYHDRSKTPKKGSGGVAFFETGFFPLESGALYI